MTQLPFWKLQSIGNDFPLVHPEDLSGLSPNELAIQICDRRFGVGGDGLLTVELEDENVLKLRMFNPDGTEDFCGNGLRCAAKHVHTLGWVGNSFLVKHLGRDVPVTVDGETIRTEIGIATYDPSSVPLRPGSEELFAKPIYWDSHQTILGSAISTGSTHVIVPVEKLPTPEEVNLLGPKIEHFPLYPERTSIMWRETLAKDHLRIAIWERGVGPTLGCGSGSSAAAMDYLRSEGRGGKVIVTNPGGSISAEANYWDQPITLEGIAFEVFEGTFQWESASEPLALRP